MRIGDGPAIIALIGFGVGFPVAYPAAGWMGELVGLAVMFGVLYMMGRLTEPGAKNVIKCAVTILLSLLSLACAGRDLHEDRAWWAVAFDLLGPSIAWLWQAAIVWADHYREDD